LSLIAELSETPSDLVAAGVGTRSYFSDFFLLGEGDAVAFDFAAAASSLASCFSRSVFLASSSESVDSRRLMLASRFWSLSFSASRSAFKSLIDFSSMISFTFATLLVSRVAFSFLSSSY